MKETKILTIEEFKTIEDKNWESLGIVCGIIFLLLGLILWRVW